MNYFDSLDAALTDWRGRRPPHDIVSRNSAEDIPQIPVGPATVVNYEITDSGIARTEENVFVGRTITRKDNNHD